MSSSNKGNSSQKTKCIVNGFIFGGLLCAFTVSMYNNWIRFPKQEEVNESETGIYALNNFTSDIHNLELGYISTELKYANSNESRSAFIEKIANTVSYTSDEVIAKNIYGNDMIDRKTKQRVLISSYVVEGEEVNLSYIDYNAIVFDEEVIKSMVIKDKLKIDDVDYSNKLVDLFCNYICSLDTLPIKSERRVPALIRNQLESKNSKEVYNYSLGDEEVEYIDTVLFSSNDFNNCTVKFTELVGKLLLNKDLTPTKDWSEWDSLSDNKKSKVVEPAKYGKYSMALNWCGAFYIDSVVNKLLPKTDEYQSPISPELGDGTKDNPAEVGTPVITYVFNNENGKVVKRPIKIELVKFGVSQDAIDYFQSKDIHNKGYNIDSEVQYCYCVFKVTNLSGVALKIDDNFSLCDKYSNIYSRTGSVSGLKSSLYLKPDETGYIETWSNSICLNRQFVIWGKDFERRIEPVWFRVLQGDLEDSTEDKGVHIVNRTSN